MSDETQTLEEATDWDALGEGRFRQTIAESWANGPGAYGGITAAALIRQMTRLLDDDDKQIRTLGMHLCAPLRFEPAVMEIEVDRRGRSISHLSAVIDQDGERCARATATFAATRPEQPRIHDMEMPEPAQGPEECDWIADTPMLPTFGQNYFAYGYALGHMPLAGADRGESGGWLKFKEPVDDGPLAAACLMDAWPPSVFSTFSTFRRTVTVDLRYQFFAADERSGQTDEPFLFHARSDTAWDGFAQEDAELWAPDGTLVSRAQQMYAILD